MLSARVIPCLDVDAGRVVKGVKFKKLRDAGDPVEVARAYEEQGADELVFLDITASSDERKTMKDVVEKTAATCFMPLTVGGGIRTVENIREMLLAGADKEAEDREGCATDGRGAGGCAGPELGRGSCAPFVTSHGGFKPGLKVFRV